MLSISFKLFILDKAHKVTKGKIINEQFTK